MRNFVRNILAPTKTNSLHASSLFFSPSFSSSVRFLRTSHHSLRSLCVAAAYLAYFFDFEQRRANKLRDPLAAEEKEQNARFNPSNRRRPDDVENVLLEAPTRNKSLRTFKREMNVRAPMNFNAAAVALFFCCLVLPREIFLHMTLLRVVISNCMHISHFVI